MLPREPKPIRDPVSRTDDSARDVGIRITRARRDAGLTQRALADLVGVRLWIVEQWESGAKAVPAEQLGRVAQATNRGPRWLETGVDERMFEHAVSDWAEPDLQQPALRFEEARRELEERAADVAKREADLRQKEHDLQGALAQSAQPVDARVESERGHAELGEVDQARQRDHERLVEIPRREGALAHDLDVQRALARVDEQKTTAGGSGQEGVAELEAERRELNDRLAWVARREVALAREEQELHLALAQVGEQRVELERRSAEFGEIETERRRYDERLAEVGEREEMLVQAERDLQQAQAQADEEHADLERARAELANIDKARREVEMSLADMSERARAVSQREAQVQALARVVAEEREKDKVAAALVAADALERARVLDSEAAVLRDREQRLVDAVKAAAASEADTVLKSAHEQARLILERARTGRQPLSERAPTVGRADDFARPTG